MIPLLAERDKEALGAFQNLGNDLMRQPSQFGAIPCSVCVIQLPPQGRLQLQHLAESAERLETVAEFFVARKREKPFRTGVILFSHRFANHVAIAQPLQRVVEEQILCGRHHAVGHLRRAFGKRVRQIERQQIRNRNQEALPRTDIQPCAVGPAVVATLGKIQDGSKVRYLRRLSAVVSPTGDQNLVHAVFLAGIQLNLGGFD